MGMKLSKVLFSGKPQPPPAAAGPTLNELREVLDALAKGNKLQATKLIRTHFSPGDSGSLQEAKDVMDAFYLQLNVLFKSQVDLIQLF